VKIRPAIVRRPQLRLVLAAGLAAAAVYLAVPVRSISSDNLAHMMTADSLLHGEAGLLDGAVLRFRRRGLAPRVYLLPSRLGGWVGPYGLGVPLALLPTIALTAAAGAPPRVVWGPAGAHLAAALWTAAGLALLLLAFGRLVSRPAALGSVLLVGLGSPALALLSREPWQHTLLFLLGAAALAVAADREPGPRGWWTVGALAGLAMLTRPTAFAYALIWAWYAWRRGGAGALRRVAVPVAAAAAAVGLVNQLYFGAFYRFGQALLPLGRLGARGLLGAHPAAALAGLLVSPGAGLLVFSPALAVAGLSLVHRRRAADRALIDLCWALFAVNLLFSSLYREWWGGWCYGPRYLTDSLPYLGVLAACGLEQLRARPGRALEIAFAVLLALSVTVQAAGLLVDPYGPRSFSAVHDIDHHPRALWSWRDAPPVHNLRLWWRGRLREALW